MSWKSHCATIWRSGQPTTEHATAPGQVPRLPFSQHLLLISHERRKQVADDSPRASLDLHCHRHSGHERHGPTVNLHLATVEADPPGINEFLAPWLAGSVFCPNNLLPRRVLPPVARDGVARNAEYA